MGSTINNFDRESLVMLYAAGELSAEDQKRVDQMLANDPALRAQLDELNAAQQVMTASFSQADAKLPMPAPMASSVRNVSRAMKQWHVDRLNAKSAPVARHGRRFGWMYSVGAVAAVIFISVFILWSRVDDGKNDHVAEIVKRLNQGDAGEDKTAPEAKDEIASYTPSAVDPEQPLTRAEGDLYTLSTLTDSLRTTEDAVTP